MALPQESNGDSLVDIKVIPLYVHHHTCRDIWDIGGAVVAFVIEAPNLTSKAPDLF